DAEKQQAQAEIAGLRAGWDRSLDSLKAQQESGQNQLAELETNIRRLKAEFAALDEKADLQAVSFYRPRYAFADSKLYQDRLDRIRDKQKDMLKSKKAAISRTPWTVNGSVQEGKKQINQTLKLILRAFNGESDAAIAKVNYKNITVMEARIEKAWETINSLVTVQDCEIADRYLNLKLEELRLVYEYEEKVQEEKEEQRRIKEQMREEEIALREIERAQEEADKEERRYAEALRRAIEEAEQASGAKQQKLLSQIEELNRRLAEAQSNKERARSRAEMTRSGHVYVISNIGSLGERVYKIGMTRRLDPMDRIKELGDASVPFGFDVHAIIFAEDAPALENALHREFHYKRINLINLRKEFFEVEIDEVAAVVRKLHGEITMTRLAEAKEYRLTLTKREERQKSQAAGLPPTPPPPIVEEAAFAEA
ncbi:MAG TPA: DUF4041 domain-containing protein, partial [Polyangiaceae bacterium]|nr:DUF4041 domain-containing protein [Polyangiaceae bacterium]